MWVNMSYYSQDKNEMLFIHHVQIIVLLLTAKAELSLNNMRSFLVCILQ